MVGIARLRAASYMSRLVVLRSVNGDEGVAAMSSFKVHCVWSSCVEFPEGRASVEPRFNAPPVRGEGWKVFAGWGVTGEEAGVKEDGYRVESGTAGVVDISTVRLANLSNSTLSWRMF